MRVSVAFKKIENIYNDHFIGCTLLKLILIIKAGKKVSSIPDDAGDFEDWLMTGMDLPAERFNVVNVYLDEALPSFESICAIIITGSAAMISDHDDWSERSAAYIKQAVERKIPVLGICYGHQLLAHALGGKVDFHPAGREIGSTFITLSALGLVDPLFKGFSEHFLVNVSHSQTVITLPAQATILGSNDFECHHAVRYSENAWGVQFHPEFNAATMLAYITERKQDLSNEGLNVEQLQIEVKETPEAEKLLLNFLNIVRVKCS